MAGLGFPVAAAIGAGATLISAWISSSSAKKQQKTAIKEAEYQQDQAFKLQRINEYYAQQQAQQNAQKTKVVLIAVAGIVGFVGVISFLKS